MQQNSQFEPRKHFSNQVTAKEILYENIPRIQYEFFFKLFGLLSSGAELRQRTGPVKKDRTAVRLRRIYCQIICALMWLFTLRSFILMFIDDRDWQVWMGDLSGYWNSYRMYYLMPCFFICLQTALTSTSFLTKERQMSWLVPFLSVKQLQVNNSRVTTDHRPYRLRINLTILFCLLLIIGSSAATIYLFTVTALDALGPNLFRWWMPWLVVQGIWFLVMGGITLLTVAYFNLVCLVIAGKFATVCKEIETLADSDPGPPGSKNDQLNQLYYDHNEVCELVDESNSFWQSYIFYTFMTYIPCACYVLYNLFFADFDFLLAAYTWSVFFLTLVLLAVICISAADVSAEAHAPYTALHTLSLLQLPIDLEVNMSTFLHRVRGPTIGFSCLDLFVVTNSSISNTIAAVASYFLIVADFSRSTITNRYKQTGDNSTTTMATVTNMFTMTTSMEGLE